LAAVLALSAGLFLTLPARAADPPVPDANRDNLAEQVRHQLVMLPYYSIFDNLQFQVADGGAIVLSGEVMRPTLKSDAAFAAGRVKGVEKVVNNIEVLPLSRYDDRIRLALYRTLFFDTQLDRYALQAVPPLHIIVKNGRVSLEGVVATQADKDVAGILANTVPGIFSVTNNLKVEKNG